MTEGPPNDATGHDSKGHDELIDGLIAVLSLARETGSEITVRLLEMALLNESGASED